VHKFLEQPPAGDGVNHGKKQIISLGAGSDTRFFRLLSSSSNNNIASSASSSPSIQPDSIVYHEFDFPEVTSRKIAAILKHKSLSRFITNLSYTSTSLASTNYHIHSIDLRNLHPDPHQSTPLPTTIDTTLPTLFISECCLIYLSPTQADDILKWITTYFPPSTTSVGLVIYEPIGGEDAFGKVMIQNLAARGIVLKTLKKYSTLRRQKERMRVMGFVTGQEACDVEFIHDRWISVGERDRIDRLEMLDEREEWMLLARHYCIAWGWRESEGLNEKGIFDGWRAFKLQEVVE